MHTRPFDWTALTLVILGALNWAMIGLFQFDLVAGIFGGMGAWLSRIVYVLIGLSGLYCLTLYNRLHKEVDHVADADI